MWNNNVLWNNIKYQIKVNDKILHLKSDDEIKRMRESSLIVSNILNDIVNYIENGISTFQIDKIIEDRIIKYKANASFKGYCGYPACTCISINEQVVHGIPRKDKILCDGDIVSIDLGILYNGYHGDAAITIGVGRITEDLFKLVKTTKECLMLGISKIEIGSRIIDISRAIQSHAEGSGFSVVRQFVGHGIGKNLHEAPEIPNYVRAGSSIRLQPGMVIAIEPMINLGTHEVKVLEDGWTVVTLDGKASAHFEHTVALTNDGVKILSEL